MQRYSLSVYCKLLSSFTFLLQKFESPERHKDVQRRDASRENLEVYSVSMDIALSLGVSVDFDKS